uniref:Uncharacterized protein n=1 Tax=Schistocephalus solidus TaxID=70667 RepID=A0A0X3NHS7_SCHSO
MSCPEWRWMSTNHSSPSCPGHGSDKIRQSIFSAIIASTRTSFPVSELLPLRSPTVSPNGIGLPERLLFLPKFRESCVQSSLYGAFRLVHRSQKFTAGVTRTPVLPLSRSNPSLRIVIPTISRCLLASVLIKPDTGEVRLSGG